MQMNLASKHAYFFLNPSTDRALKKGSTLRSQVLFKSHVGLRHSIAHRPALKVKVLSNVNFISQLKPIWLSAKLLIKIRTLSTDSAILIWIFICITGSRIYHLFTFVRKYFFPYKFKLKYTVYRQIQLL